MSLPHARSGAVASFLRELLTSGAPVVRLSGAANPDGCLEVMQADAAQDASMTAQLRDWHGEACEDLAGPALAFDEAAARRGAATLFRAAWFYLHRDAEAAQVKAMLAATVPVPTSAAAIFSADLTLRYLPDVYRMARTLAPGDPLLAALQSLANAQPLSGAGIEPEEGTGRAPEAAAWNTLRRHPGLWRLFIDRVIGAKARWWMAHDEVRRAVRSAAGAFARDLVPAFDLADVPAPAPVSSTHEPTPA